MLLGAIADDLTGATDLALTLTRGGMRTLQVMDVPRDPAVLEGYDAVVVALKSRTNPVAEAVEMSLASADALLGLGARQLFFKYCSTFDSTDDGNIGPVAEALLRRLDAPSCIATPAFPTNGRTVYFGNLFVGDVPLAESPMKDHPLTPMRDSNLVRVLQRQTQVKVGLVPYSIVDEGAPAIASALKSADAADQRMLIVDALSDRHLIGIGEACADMKLVTGGSGAALGLPANFERAGLLKPAARATRMPAPAGRAAILAGSCSQATREQIKAAIGAEFPNRAVDPLELAGGAVAAGDLIDWAREQAADKPFLIYSSADPDTVGAVQAELGRDAAGSLVEDMFAEIARALPGLGVTRLIVAGGETSGAVGAALGLRVLEIGPEIDPGVPWTRNLGEPELVVALKSGNFGAPDFFLKSWELLS